MFILSSFASSLLLGRHDTLLTCTPLKLNRWSLSLGDWIGTFHPHVDKPHTVSPCIDKDLQTGKCLSSLILHLPETPLLNWDFGIQLKLFIEQHDLFWWCDETLTCCIWSFMNSIGMKSNERELDSYWNSTKSQFFVLVSRCLLLLCAPSFWLISSKRYSALQLATTAAVKAAAATSAVPLLGIRDTELSRKAKKTATSIIW